MTDVQHRFIEANGIRMHIAEKGSGPLILMCHGFPESWYSWRHQIEALAAGGFRAVAPDMRGYGQTDAPEAIDQYTLFHLIGDMVGLLDALNEPTAVIAGHDWGAPVAWHAALMRPDRFRAVAGLSVPYRPRGPVRPTTAMPKTDDAMFYQLYFQTPGVAEAELESDVGAYMRGILYSNSGDAPRSPTSPAERGNVGMVPRDGGLRARMATHMANPKDLPAWLAEADIDFYTGEFTRTGFRGCLNWYRNIDRNWELLAPFDGVPALYIAGDRDPVVKFPGMERHIADMPKFVPQLHGPIMLPGCGHITQEERAAEVSAAMIDFIRSLPRP